jgi:hypothetical protein
MDYVILSSIIKLINQILSEGSTVAMLWTIKLLKRLGEVSGTWNILFLC